VTVCPGVTLVGPRASDQALLQLAGRLQRASVTRVGASQTPLPTATWARRLGCVPAISPLPYAAPIFRACRSTINYATVALSAAGHHERPSLSPVRPAGRSAHRPGMIRVSVGGAAIEVEVWAVPAEHLGSFVAGIPAPLG